MHGGKCLISRSSSCSCKTDPRNQPKHTFLSVTKVETIPLVQSKVPSLSTVRMFASLNTTSYVKGVTPTGQKVTGRWSQTFPGIGVEVVNNSNTFLLVDKIRIALGGHVPHASPELPPTIDKEVHISTKQVLTWLNEGYVTKACFTAEELIYKRLIDPLSADGLQNTRMPSPILLPSIFSSLDREHPIPVEDNPPQMDAEFVYFLNTGEHPPHREGYEAPLAISQQIVLRKKQMLERWHVNRAIAARRHGERILRKETPCGRVWCEYTFDDEHHLLRVDTSLSPTLSYRLPTHPPTPPFSPIQLGDPPSPIASVASATGLDLAIPPRVYEKGRYSAYLKALTEEELERHQKEVEDEKDDVMSKLADIREEQRARKLVTAGERVKRLTRSELEEALEEATHLLGSIRRKYAGRPIPLEAQDTRDTTLSWCMAALEELRTRE